MEVLGICKSVCGNELSNTRTFIIGGGTSLKGFDFNRLKGYGHVIVINDALLSIPWADSFFTCDYRWVGNRSNQLQKFQGKIYLAIPQEKFPKDVSFTALKREYRKGYSEDKSLVHLGGNSGFAALNLATLMGAKDIFLFGYDFYTEQNERHFHGGYDWDHNGSARYYKSWAEGFGVSVPVIRKNNIRVLNFSLYSSLRYFPRHELPELESFLKV